MKYTATVAIVLEDGASARDAYPEHTVKQFLHKALIIDWEKLPAGMVPSGWSVIIVSQWESHEKTEGESIAETSAHLEACETCGGAPHTFAKASPDPETETVQTPFDYDDGSEAGETEDFIEAARRAREAQADGETADEKAPWPADPRAR